MFSISKEFLPFPKTGKVSVSCLCGYTEVYIPEHPIIGDKLCPSCSEPFIKVVEQDEPGSVVFKI